MRIETNPLFEELRNNSKRILVSGAGGGFDIYCGLPIYFHLKHIGKTVFLSNLSFSNLHIAKGPELTPFVREVSADSGGSSEYFPEKYLCQWFREKGEEISIHCFHRIGAIPIYEAYQAICKKYDIDTVILADGGTDSLMRGDEAGLGTPQEDIASIAAVDELDIKNKYLLCTGFGIDAYHGVNHAQYLEAVACLCRKGAYLGCFSMLPDMEEVRLYKEACQYVFERMPSQVSIVSSSVISATDGEYGDYHVTSRTRGSKLWINPLMSIYWAFRLEEVAKRCLYIEEIRKTREYFELSLIIGKFRASYKPIKPWEVIPV